MPCSISRTVIKPVEKSKPQSANQCYCKWKLGNSGPPVAASFQINVCQCQEYCDAISSWMVWTSLTCEDAWCMLWLRQLDVMVTKMVPNLSGAPPRINFWGYDLQSLEDAFWNQYGPRKGVTNFVAGKFSGCAKSPPGIATLPQPFGSSWLYTTVVVLDLMTIYIYILMPVQFLPTVELGRGHDIPCYIIRSNSPTQ